MSKKKFYLLEAPVERANTPWQNEEGQVVAIVIHAGSESEAKMIATDNHFIDWERSDVRVTILDETYEGDTVIIEHVSFPSKYR